MKYIIVLTLLAIVAGCSKNEEEPCPVYDYDMVEKPLNVLVFIDKDSNNLLATNVLDTNQITINNTKGIVQKFKAVLDTNRTKALFIEVPSSQSPNNILHITAKGTSHTFSYNIVTAHSRCSGTYSYEDNFKLDNIAFTPVFSHSDYISLYGYKTRYTLRKIFITLK